MYSAKATMCNVSRNELDAESSEYWCHNLVKLHSVALLELVSRQRLEERRRQNEPHICGGFESDDDEKVPFSPP